MATLIKTLYQEHAGARWLVPFLVVLIALVLLAFAMLMYPHL